MELRPYQQKAVEWLCEHERGLVVAPAGSGKTIVAAAALDRVLNANPCKRHHRPELAWIANTKEQATQGQAALDSFLVGALANVSVECAAAERWYGEVAGIVVDEAHHAPSPTWRKQIESCKGVRWGFTATPWTRDRQRNETLKALFGGNVFVIDREEVGQNLAPARVVWLDAADEGLAERIDAAVEKELSRRLRFRRYQRMPIQQARGEVAWGVCNELGIFKNNLRNTQVELIALAATEPTIVLANYVEHAKQLASHIPGSIVCHSGMKNRKASLDAFRKGDVRCLVATSLLDEGADFPCAEVLVLASGGRNEARTIQRTGRVLRPHPGKTMAFIYDFRDTFHPLMARHAEKREAIYEKLGYLTGGV